MLPIGQRCNIDDYILDHTPYFDVVECNLESFYCGGICWYKENLGSTTTPHFGQLCCSKGKIELVPFPVLTDDLSNLFAESHPNANATT